MNVTYLTRRQLSILGSLICLAVLCVAYFLETYRGVQPCPLCLLQRLAFLIMGIVFLLNAFDPHNNALSLFYAFTNAVVGLFGAGVAVRQIWLQHLPKGEVPLCGASFERMFQLYPTLDAFKKILQNSGDCAAITYQIMGLGLAEWSLVMFAFLFILCIYCRCARN